MFLVEPERGAPISGVRVPTELYWVVSSPAPLAGMNYPRPDLPWSQLKAVGFSRVVSLHHGSYNAAPSPWFLRDAKRETEVVKRAVAATVSALRAGEGIVIHCMGGRGRTGTVLGCVLRELGYDAEMIVDHLDRVHKARGKPGWPESPWQGELVHA